MLSPSSGSSGGECSATSPLIPADFKRWFEELSARPGVKRGMEAGSDMSVDTSSLSEEEIKRLGSMLYNQRARPAPEGGLL